MQVLFFGLEDFVDHAAGFVDGEHGAGQGIEEDGLEELGFVFLDNAPDGQLVDVDLGAAESGQLGG